MRATEVADEAFSFREEILSKEERTKYQNTGEDFPGYAGSRRTVSFALKAACDPEARYEALWCHWARATSE